MKMSIEEVYVGGCPTEINIEFESAARLPDSSRDILILKTLSDSTFYNYTITRSIRTRRTETSEVASASGQDDFEITLFDTPYFTFGDSQPIISPTTRNT